jgi:hypothetical protein
VPDGYPQRVEKPWVWSGSEMAADRYVVWLNEDDVAQTEEALGFFRGQWFCKAAAGGAKTHWR